MIAVAPNDPEAYYIVGFVDWTEAYKNAVAVLAADGLTDDGEGNKKMTKAACAKLQQENLPMVNEGLQYLQSGSGPEPELRRRDAVHAVELQAQGDLECATTERGRMIWRRRTSDPESPGRAQGKRVEEGTEGGRRRDDVAARSAKEDGKALVIRGLFPLPRWRREGGRTGYNPAAAIGGERNVMNEDVLVNEESRGLSQAGRVVNAFVAPAETFRDILRSAAWWLPFVLMVVFSLGSTYAIDRKVGFDRVAENQVNASPKQQETMSELTPQERATQMHQRPWTRYVTYAVPVIVLTSLIYAGIMLGSFNFGWARG